MTIVSGKRTLLLLVIFHCLIVNHSRGIDRIDLPTAVKNTIKNSIYVDVLTGVAHYFSEDGKIKIASGKDKFISYNYRLDFSSQDDTYFSGYLILLPAPKLSGENIDRIYFFGRRNAEAGPSISEFTLNRMIKVTDSELKRIKRGEISLESLLH